LAEKRSAGYSRWGSRASGPARAAATVLFILVAGRDPVVSAGSTHISPSDASATARPSGQPCRSGAVQGAGHEAENLVGEAGDACPTEEGRQVSRGERWSSGAGGLLADDLQDGGRPEVEPGQRADSCEACPGIIPAQPPVQPSPRIGPGSGHILRCPRHIHGQGTRSHLRDRLAGRRTSRTAPSLKSRSNLLRVSPIGKPSP